MNFLNKGVTFMSIRASIRIASALINVSLQLRALLLIKKVLVVNNPSDLIIYKLMCIIIILNLILSTTISMTHLLLTVMIEEPIIIKIAEIILAYASVDTLYILHVLLILHVLTVLNQATLLSL